MWSRQHAQPARHPQVQQQVAVSKPNQDVFATPVDRLHLLADEARLKVRGNGPAQASVAHLNGLHPLPDDVWRNAAPGGFDFGQLRHVRAPAAGGYNGRNTGPAP